MFDQLHAHPFPLAWSHYVRLLSVRNVEARAFYEAEALRGGWSVRQLDRQISSQFYERMALSRKKAALPKKARPGSTNSPCLLRSSSQKKSRRPEGHWRP